MAGFTRRNFKTTNVIPKSGAGSYKSSTISFLSTSYDDNDNLVIRLKGINDSDISTLNNLYPDIFQVKTIQGYINTIIVKGDKIDDFENIIDSLKDEFVKLGYKPVSVGGAITAIIKSISNTPTQAEIDKNNTTIANNWKELLTKLQDPETRKRLLTFQTKYIASIPELEHLKLSRANITDVLSSDPLASFVTSADYWEKYFDRKVIPNAQYIIITKPEENIDWSSLYNDSAIVKMGKGNGYANWKEFVKQNGGPYAPIVFNLKKKYNKAKHFYKTKVVDVRFTRPIDPSNDKFMKIINLANNLTGELNSVAKEALKKSGVSDDVDAKKVGIEDNADLIKYKDFIIGKCKARKINVSEHGDINDVIANAIFEYSKSVAVDLNMLSPKKQNAFACGVCYSVATSFNIQSSRVASYVQFFKQLTQDEASELSMDVYNTYKTLTNISQLNESVMNKMHIMSFEELRNSLINLAQGEKENLHEGFGGKYHIMSFDELHNNLVSLASGDKPTISEVKDKFNNFMERMNNVPK